MLKLPQHDGSFVRKIGGWRAYMEFCKKKGLLNRRVKKVGRNEPCPCDSGKKFKKCCINQSGG